MTREEADEAIEKLKWLLDCNYVDSFEDEENEAIKLGIKALKQYGVLQEIRAELTKAYVDPYNRNAFRYTTVSLLDVLDLIDKHLKEFEE